VTVGAFARIYISYYALLILNLIHFVVLTYSLQMSCEFNYKTMVISQYVFVEENILKYSFIKHIKSVFQYLNQLKLSRFRLYSV